MIQIKNFVNKILGRPTYIPLYAEDEHDGYFQIGWIRWDLNDAYIYCLDGVNECAIRLDGGQLSRLEIKAFKDGFLLVNKYDR